MPRRVSSLCLCDCPSVCPSICLCVVVTLSPTMGHSLMVSCCGVFVKKGPMTSLAHLASHGLPYIACTHHCHSLPMLPAHASNLRATHQQLQYYMYIYMYMYSSMHGYITCERLHVQCTGVCVRVITVMCHVNSSASDSNFKSHLNIQTYFEI